MAGGRRHRSAVLALLAAAVAIGVVGAMIVGMRRGDRPTSCRQWVPGVAVDGVALDYTGYGQAEVCRLGSGRLWRLSPLRASAPAVTHSALARTTVTYADMLLRVRVRTARQLRHPRPEPWEVAWVVWQHTDDRHFYSLVLKPNGWELGKEDPAYPGSQRFLRTSDKPRYDIGEWHTVEIRQRGDAIAAEVDGRSLVRLRDQERPYLTGRVGLYTEDATAEFTDLRVHPGG